MELLDHTFPDQTECLSSIVKLLRNTVSLLATLAIQRSKGNLQHGITVLAEGA